MDQVDREWLAAVQAGHPPGAFGHREHLRLAWLALGVADTVEAAERDVCASIRAIAAKHGAPQKYNQTVTAAWVRIIDHVRHAYVESTFDEVLDLLPWLFEKRLLLRHYRSQTLASDAARSSYVPPDLRPIPS
jgi:hypothetical protein